MKKLFLTTLLVAFGFACITTIEAQNPAPQFKDVLILGSGDTIICEITDIQNGGYSYRYLNSEGQVVYGSQREDHIVTVTRVDKLNDKSNNRRNNNRRNR